MNDHQWRFELAAEICNISGELSDVCISSAVAGHMTVEETKQVEAVLKASARRLEKLIQRS